MSDVWLGDAKRGIEPYRDTGVELRGPAVADLTRAFSEMWALNGTAIPAEELATSVYAKWLIASRSQTWTRTTPRQPLRS